MTKKVAVVDGGDAASQLETAGVAPPDFQVYPCPLAEGTLACIRRASPDVVVVMLESPEATELNLIRLLRDDPGTVDIPVVLCTPRPARVGSLVEELRRLGIYVLYQPFAAEELLQALAMASTPGRGGE